MAKYQRKFEVANPSPYERSDYVEVNLQLLDVPPDLNENFLVLSRISTDGTKEEIPYQIDYILGRDFGKRMLTFLSTRTQPGPDDYSKASETFILEEGNPKDFTPTKQYLWAGHYYKEPTINEPTDGFNKQWFSNRDIYGVKLYNNLIPKSCKQGEALLQE